MKSDIYGQQIFNEADLCLLYLQNPLRTIKYAFVEKDINFDDILQLENTPKLVKYIDPKTSTPQVRRSTIRDVRHLHLSLSTAKNPH